jgi:hypothetical protein
MIEATMLLVTILRRVHLECQTGHPVEILPSVTLRPKHGVRVIVHLRHPPA